MDDREMGGEVDDKAIAWALGLRAVDYAAAWQDFRRAAALHEIAMIERLDGLESLPVIGTNGLIAQTSIGDPAALRYAQRVGDDEIIDRRLPYSNGFALISVGIDGSHSISLVGTTLFDLAEGAVTVVEFGRIEGVWTWVITTWWTETHHLAHCKNDFLVMPVKHPEEIASVVALIIGLMALPRDMVQVEQVTRPITRGRAKPHPLSPGSVLTLSYDPVRIIGTRQEPRGTHVSPGFSFQRRGTVVTNKFGTTFQRRATIVMKHLPRRDQVRVARLDHT